MKELRVLLVTLLAGAAAIQAQTWELQFGAPRHEGMSFSVTDMTAVGSHVWAAGRGIWYSADAGQTWSVQMDTRDRLWYVDFRDTLSGWAVGEQGWIAHTEDGGQTWNNQTLSQDLTLEAIAFVNEDRGWVVGWEEESIQGVDSAFVALTTDGGVSWNPMELHLAGCYYGIAFADENHGFIYGSAQSLETTDGGETWMEGNFPEVCYVAIFANATLGWATGASGVVYRTTDGGETWEGTQVGERFYDIWFLNESDGWVVGSDGRVAATTDGGDSWQLSFATSWQKLRGVVFFDTMHGLVGGESGVMRVTEDGGQTWRNLFGNEEGWPTLQAVAFDELGFDGWVVGQGGAILHTRDGGYSWAVESSGVLYRLHDVALAGSDSAWTVGEGGHMTRTTDGGETWNAEVICDYYLDGVTFIDPLKGWAVGGGGTILHTCDGGVTWDAQTSGTEYYLNDVSFNSPWTGCAVGDLGTIVYTTNGGATWNPANSGISAVIHGVLLLPNGRGWAVADGERILSTASSGAVWTRVITAPSASWRDLAYLGDSQLIAVGGSGAIWRSTDWGHYWWPDSSGVSERLFGCIGAQDGRYAWVVGENGVVLHAGGVVSNSPSRPDGLPQDYSLAVYPNPFNPSATIAFDLPATTHVSLTVYDVTGRMVQRLTDGMLSAGVHSVALDGSRLSSGIYFARLDAGNVSQTRKLILLR